jgi:hypothetical protein
MKMRPMRLRALAAVRDPAQVELEEVPTVGRDEDARDLGACEGSGDGLGIGGANDDGTTGGMSLLQARLVANVVEDECLAEVDLTFDHDLRHPPARGSEPPFPHECHSG